MSRMVSIFLPHLPLERLKRSGKALPDDRPFALVGSEERGLLLTAVNAASADQGLIPGMGLADARAICPHLLTAPAEARKDAEALLALASWASVRYSPTLNIDGADGLWLDVTGVPHLFGGEAALLADLAERLARAGLTAQLALAETLGGAHALARFARSSPSIVPDGEIARGLADLPVEALRLEPAIALLLRRLGLKRIGQLCQVPRASLERRFHAKDMAEAVLVRLDQALGRREEMHAPLSPDTDFMARLPFPEPLITHEGVLAGLDHLADELCATLARKCRGARRAALWLCRSDGSSAVIEAGLSAPSRVAKHLVALFKDKIEGVDMGFGVDLMAFSALVTETLPPAQTSLAVSTRKAAPEPLIDRLVNRLGGRAVRRLFPRASHIPELAQSACSVLARGDLARSDFATSWSGHIPRKPPRPPLLLARPEALSVLAEIPEGPPARFTWRHVTARVVKAEGPERIAPEWWRSLRTSSPSPSKREGGDGLWPSPGGGHSTQATLRPDPLSSPPPFRGREGARPRDYYRIEDEDGRRYWVFREGLYQESEDVPPGWFLHGVFG
ncbi:MAG TPA: DNA polymerase Y family protein [Methyloceanibacter sp.]